MGHPVNGEVGRGSVPSGSQICFAACLSIQSAAVAEVVGTVENSERHRTELASP